MNQVLALAQANKGFVTSTDATMHRVQRRELTQAVHKGELIKIGRGLYCTPDTWEDDYVVAQHRFARGIFSHDTALYLLELSDQAPEILTMSFPRGYNPSAVRRAGVIPKSSPKNLHDLGITQLTTPFGNLVRVYNAERSLCDMIRGTTTPDVQRLNPAIRSYLASSKKSLPQLLEYADRLGVKTKIRHYLEVLL